MNAGGKAMSPSTQPSGRHSPNALCLLTPSCCWCDTQVASTQHPSGLKLHSAATFRQEHGFEPCSYPDFLALVGKPKASIKGVGVSTKLAKTLLNK